MLTKKQMFKTGTALAVCSLLSACATSGGLNGPQYPLEKITHSVTEAGTRIWDGTRHLFKLRDRSGDETVDEYFDEVDVALLDVENFDVELFETDDVDATGVAVPIDLEELGESTVADSADPANITDDDIYHTVSKNESLWIISKNLTGNAGNWKLLAELNDIDPEAPLWVGQKVRIPATLKLEQQDDLSAGATVLASAEAAAPVSAEQGGEEELVVAEQTSKATEPTEAFTVLAGENLWVFSKRTTGNPVNWTKIAAANGMDEVQANSIRYGQKIKVPVSMLSDEAVELAGKIASKDEAKKLPQPEAAEAAVAVAKAIKPKTPQSNAADVEVADADTVPAGKELVMVDANFRSEPPKLELATEANTTLKQANNAAKAAVASSDEIMVSGTYYPKAIYNDANFSSSLLMRVSPGTRLKISKAVGPWYEVMTEKGVGYVHSRDTK